MRSALARILQAATTTDQALLTDLAKAYKYKEVSDYGIGLGAVLSLEDAHDAIDAAALFLQRTEALLLEPRDLD